MHATLDERADLVAQRDKLQQEASDLQRQLNAETRTAFPSYDETQLRSAQELRAQHIRRTIGGLSTRIDLIDQAARQDREEQERLRDYLGAQLQAARLRRERVESEKEHLAPVLQSLERRHQLVQGEISALEGRIKALQPQPATTGGPWGTDPNDDSGDPT